jgi:hypothetical protein
MEQQQFNIKLSDSPFSSISYPLHEDCTEVCSAIHRNLHIRVAQMILHSRLLTHLRYPRPYSIGTKITAVNNIEKASTSSSLMNNKWFNLDLDDDPDIRGIIKEKLSHSANFSIDIYLEWDDCIQVYIEPPKESELKLISILQNRILLETWSLTMSNPPKNERESIDLHYKKMVVMIRGLHSLLRLLPSYRLCRLLKKGNKGDGLRISYSLYNKETIITKDFLPLSESILQEGIREVASIYSLPKLHTNHGEIKIEVNYRNNCKFQTKSTQNVIKNRMIEGVNQRDDPKSLSFETIDSHNPLQNLLGNSPQNNLSIRKKTPSGSDLKSSKFQNPITGSQQEAGVDRKTLSPTTIQHLHMQAQSQPAQPIIPSSFHRSKSSTSSNDISIFVRQLEALKYTIDEDDSAEEGEYTGEDIWKRYQNLKEKIEKVSQERNCSITPIKEEERDDDSVGDSSGKKYEEDDELLFPFQEEENIDKFK